jgi:hypothetical protein
LICIHPFGLGESNVKVHFTEDLDSVNHRLSSLQSHKGSTVEVELVRADDILSSVNPILMKIDVEGGELNVLKGARSLLSKTSLKAVIMETFQETTAQQDVVNKCEEILLDHGFNPFSYDPRNRSLAPLYGLIRKQNTIYIKDIEIVAVILKNSAKIAILQKTY